MQEEQKGGQATAYFVDLPGRVPKQMLEGVRTRTFWGDRMLLSVVDLDANSVVPTHVHPHEQVGVVLEGEVEMEIGGETRRLVQGDMYIVPGGVEHAARCGNRKVRVLDVFSPVRDEFKY